MKAEYDFSGGKRGAVLSSRGKTRITIYLDDEIVRAFKAESERTGRGYQTLINESLAQYAGVADKPVTAAQVRRILREELVSPEAGSREARPMTTGDTAREVREAAALKYKPEKVRLLLVAEAPPRALDRFFFFESVASNDWLFRGVVKSLFGQTPDRPNKIEWLTKLKKRGVFLVDLKVDPVDGSSLTAHVPDLVARCQLLRPERIILIKTSVYDAAYQSLKSAGLPVVDKRIPFPATGHQGEFRAGFGAALELCGWH